MKADSWMLAGVAAVAFAVAAAITFMVRQYALRTNLLDHPNARSSHVRATPRGGGLSIVIVSLLGTVALWSLGWIGAHLCIALVVGGGLIAGVGFIDDRQGVPVRVRLLVHLIAALLAVLLLGGFTRVEMGQSLLHPGIGGTIFMTLGVIWSTNLFNFMDGIDGLAGTQAITMLAGMGVVALVSGAPGESFAPIWLISAATFGFLVWNWPPASIFMGDVGSGFLGYVIAVIALVDGRENLASLTGWLILGTPFILDATITLFRRVARGERASEAHRSHAYQWLSRRWKSHRPVTVALLVLNALCLLPVALLANRQVEWSGWILLTAWAALASLLWWIGAGRREQLQ